MATKQRCEARITNPRYPDAGRQCKKWAVNGAKKCQAHGGLHDKIDGLVAEKNRCTAKSSRTGDRCRNNAIKGGVVCRIHGGAAEHVRKKARERLMEMVDPALAELNRMLQAPGTSDSDRTRIALAVLDRTGYGPNSHVEVTIKPWEKALQTAFKQVGGEGAPMPMILRAHPDGEVLDAELVEDEEWQDEDEDSDVIVFQTEPEPPRIGSPNPPRRN